VKIVSVMTTNSLGGAEFAAVELLDALVARGHEAVMLSNDRRIVRDSAVEAREVELGPKLARASWPGLVARWPALRHRLRNALEAEWPYDVLLVHYKKEQLLAATLPRRLRRTVAWAEWGPVPYELRRGLPRSMFLAAARRASVVMAVSPGTGASLEDVGLPGGRVHVVPNAMRTDEIRFDSEGRRRVRAALDIPADAFVVGCISRFHHKKRNDVVIDAVHRLDGAAHLILAGAGDTEPDLRERAAALGPRAHFVPTPGADVGHVLSAFDVAVTCPSPTEGAPRAVILAMLVERPSLATSAEGMDGLLTDDVGGILVPENDPEALAARLGDLARDEERRRREGARARRLAVERFDSRKVAEQAEALLAGAADGR
jgi:glycosyltransferase involved in cell wall biosynthesis